MLEEKHYARNDSLVCRKGIWTSAVQLEQSCTCIKTKTYYNSANAIKTENTYPKFHKAKPYHNLEKGVTLLPLDLIL